MDTIKKLREKLNLNQADFAKKISLTQSHLSAIESGNRNLTERTAKLICAEWDVSWHWIWTGEEPIFNNEGNAKISALVSALKLDSYSQAWLKAFLSMEKKQRGIFSKTMITLGEIATKDNAINARGEILDALEDFGGDEAELEDSILGAFSANFQFVDFPKTERINSVPTHSADTEMGDDGLDSETMEGIDAKFRDELINEKRQGALAFISENSELKPNKKSGSA